jgi:hypothetical protein
VGLPFALVLFAIAQGSALLWDKEPAAVAVGQGSERLPQSEAGDDGGEAAEAADDDRT